MQRDDIMRAEADSLRADATVSSEADPDAANGSQSWPEPVPLVPQDSVMEPYPLAALPDTVRTAVEAYLKVGQQPVALVACSALGAMSLVCQGLVNVRRDGNLVGPVSLNFLVVAESGERKTSADRRMARAIREWMNRELAERGPEHRRARARLDAQLARKEGLLGEIRSLARKSKPDSEADRQELERELEQLAAGMEHVPPLPQLFFEDSTPEALTCDLASGWPSAALWSNEGGLVVGSKAMSEEAVLRFLALLNRLWDGETFTRRRSTSENIELRDRRLTACLMVQPAVFQRLLQMCDGLVRGTGNLARFLIASPTSTRGQRLYRTADQEAMPLRRFDERLTTLLDIELPVAKEAPYGLKPAILSFTPAAFDVWRQHYDRIERGQAMNKDWHDLPDIASKIPEQTARLAAVFHCFEHEPRGEIAADTMQQAVAIAEWHLGEARRVLSLNTTVTRELAEAQKLLDWIVDEPDPVHIAGILQRGPSSLRNKAARNRAITCLEDHHLLRRQTISGTIRLVVNPLYLERARQTL